jgi:uncharacterized protein YuzE
MAVTSVKINDIMIVTYPDTDTVAVYMGDGDPPPGLIDNSDEIFTGIEVDYDVQNKIVAFDLYYAYARVDARERQEDYIRKHVSYVKDGNYGEGTSVLVFYFHESKGNEVTDLMSTEDDRILIGTSPSGHLRCLSIKEPEKNIIAMN